MPYPNTNGRRATPEGHRVYSSSSHLAQAPQGLPRNGHIQGSRPYPAKEGSTGQELLVPRSSDLPSSSTRSYGHSGQGHSNWVTQQRPSSPRSPGRYIKNTRQGAALNGPPRSPPTSRSHRVPAALGPGQNPANAQWPESYGFSLAGDGPVYVIAVQRDSVAHKAGLVPGDQLLEVDGHNVTSMSLESVCTLARHSRQSPPTVGVVSRIQYAELIASRRWGYGMTLRGVRPTYVDGVDPHGPAYHAGIRPGDLVLELNGRKIRDLTLLRPVLNTRHGRVTLAVVPVESKSSQSASQYSLKGGAQIRTTEASRLRKAKDLFAKMNLVLQQDYERKMAVVGLLKQYAEDRQVDSFAGGLNFVLRTPEHRQLIQDIRPFIPVKHRQRFDVILQYDPLVPTSLINQSAHASNFSTLTPHQLAAAREGTVREVKVYREKGSFGFVLRGHNPVYVETVNPGGPAENAGILPGDALLKLNGLDIRHSTHSHVIKLLQGSGSAPKVQVQQLLDENGVPVLFDGSTTENSSSSTSHSSNSDWPADDGPYSHMVDRGGRTFRQRVDHLLTPQEKGAFRRALINYSNNKNASQLVDDLNVMLDTPSKRTLWGFILPRMTTEHREYVIKYIDLPKQDLQEYLAGRMAPDSRDSTLQRAGYRQDETESSSSPGPINIRGSFRHQLDYLLTSRERSQLKKALQIYAEKRNVHNLLEDLEEILDTPSKKTLWFYIIPLLSPHHQQYCQRHLGLPTHVVSQGEKGRSETSNGYLSSDGRFTHPRMGATGDYGMSELGESTATLNLGDFEEWADDEEDDSTDGGHHGAIQRQNRPKLGGSDIIQPWDGEQSTVTLQPSFVDEGGREKSYDSRRRANMKESSVQTTPRNSLRDNNYRTVIRVYDNPGLTADIIEQKNRHSLTSKDFELQVYEGHSGDDRQGDGQSIASSQVDGQMSVGYPNGILKTDGSVSDAESTASTVKNSINSLESFQARAMKAISALDDVVANEPSDFESASILNFNDPSISGAIRQSSTSSSLPSEQGPSPDTALQSVVTAEALDDTPNIPIPPAPPAPPLPPGLGAGLPGGKNLANSMQVKRMNWEKIDHVDENTVWAKLKDPEDLEDVVKYLELEQQFSTKKNKISESFRHGKSEVSILAPKKAYNISILLGHLRKPVTELQQSLLRTDEEVLTQELLRQILAYAPDPKEGRMYDDYKAPLDQLSKPDQFMYQLRQVPGYKERMKAMLFKANFAEKVEEVKKNLDSIKSASSELQNSKKLAKILELVLAMGNYMNKGHARVGEAQAFRISILAQLDLTKTSNNKGTFLNVLAQAVQNKYPECLPLSKDLPHINIAAKVTASVSNEDIAEEIDGLRQMLDDIQNTVDELRGMPNKVPTVQDRFQDTMAQFLSQAKMELETLRSLQRNTVQEFGTMAQYFGEDPRDDSGEIFSVFADFVTKLERAYQQNLQNERTRPRNF